MSDTPPVSRKSSRKTQKRAAGIKKTVRAKTTARPAQPACAMNPGLYSAVIDNVPQILYCTDLKGRLIHANAQYCATMGKPLKELLGKTAYDFFPKALADKYTTDDQRVIRSGRTLEIEETNQAPMHEPIHVRVVKTPLRDKRGRIVGVQGVYWDVSGERKAAARIAQQAYLLNMLLETLPHHVYFKDTQGRFIRIGKSLATQLGLDDPKKAVGTSDYDYFPRDEAETFQREERAIIATGRPLVNKEEPKTYPDGTPGWTSTTKMPMRDEEGRITGVFGVSQDITKLKATEQRLAQQNYFMATLMDTIPDYIYFKDAESRFIMTSRAHTKLLGVDDPADAVGKTDYDFFSHDDAEQFMRDEMEILSTGRALVGKEEKAKTPSGSTVWISTSKMPLRDPKGAIIGTLGVSRDITDRKRAEELLYRRAFYDPLTELPNRALFMDRLAHLFRRLQRHPEALFAVLFLDLDRFKAVNDSLGHKAGDALLIATAQRLETCVRPGDTVARLGGDEFTVLLEEVSDVTDAIRVAERILAALAVPVRVLGSEVFGTVSIGIALSSSGYAKADDILRDADTAMYGAKSHGKARYEVFDAAMHDRAVVLLETENNLRRALERNEFRVHYQPIVRLADKRILGFEALVRWMHPERGLLLPDRFLPSADELGLMGQIGSWVLREACTQTRAWQVRYPSDPPLRVNVNMSSRQLQQKGFLAQVRWILENTGLDARSLTLEVTEQTLVENLKSTASVLAQLRTLAVQVHIDNFGTSYALLHHLGQYPADMLKVDRSLIRLAETDELHAKVLRTIVQLAQSLGIKVTAEGVETSQQLERLTTLKCGTAQGFFFSEPLDAIAVDALLAGGGVWTGSQ